ncbi:MAG: AAA family ATPase [bacterium]
MHLKKLDINIFENAFQETLVFKPGLNIISGENGTGKTTVLKLIKQTKGTSFSEQGIGQKRILAFSPKRNSQRQQFQQILQDFRRHNKTYSSITTERIEAKLDDDNFSNYESLAGLFYAFFEEQTKDGSDRKQKMKEVTDEFNTIIQSVFSDYRLESTWDKNQGLPHIFLTKNQDVKVPIHSLSTGEQEVLSLILNLYVTGPKVDIVLIDEPEIHLNWHLEKKLFEYFLNFTKDHNKQLIISTHSRVIFRPEFLDKVIFLSWIEKKIKALNELPADQRKRIAGEAIEIIKIGDFSNPTFFVEDDSHKEIIEIISDHLGSKIYISKAGNSPNVKSLFRLSKAEGGWANSFFVIDGDNQGNPYPNENDFIHLEKYCLENYLLNIKLLMTSEKKKKGEIQEIILDAIKNNKAKILKKNKYFEFLVDRLKKSDIQQESIDRLDASEILNSVLMKLGKSRKQLTQDLLSSAKTDNQLYKLFPEKLIRCIRGA